MRAALSRTHSSTCQPAVLVDDATRQSSPARTVPNDRSAPGADQRPPGDVATTLSHPATTSHRGQTAEQWARQGITPGLVRLSIGLEDPEDLWDDFARSLDRL